MSFAGINYLAVVIAAIAGFGVGAVWYSFLFQKPWMEAMGITAAAMQARASGAAPSTPLPLLLGGSLVGNLVMAFILSAVLHALGAASFGGGIGIAFLVWLGFVITVMGVNNAFGMRNPMLTVIDGGHWLVVLLVMGAIIGVFG
jgi:hypothetical protein